MKIRVQKLMSRAGLGSRRQSERLIREGRVRINGRRAKLGDRANPSEDRIEVDGERLRIGAVDLVYVALHKPKGVISSLADELQQGRTTVRDLVNIPGHLYPVGRLDKQSTGLMLLTNDGELAHKLTHPRYEHEKAYRVILEGGIGPEQLKAWRNGVWLDGRKTAPAKVRVIAQDNVSTQLEIIMHEGRKRQIRRVASLFDQTIISLKREKIGPLKLGTLEPGKWRLLTDEELIELRSTVTSSQDKQD